MQRASVVEARVGERLPEITAGLSGPGFAVVDGLLGARRARLIYRALGAHREAFAPAGIGAGVQEPGVRRDETWWLDESTAPGAVLPLLFALDVLRRGLSRSLCLPLVELECHAACYPPGAFYASHLDELRGGAGRRVSYVYYPNPAWTERDGGALLLEGEPPTEVLPLEDRLVVFRSATLRHAVLPTRRERYSVTGWMRVRPELPLGLR